MRRETTSLLALLILFVFTILAFFGFFYYQTVKTNQNNLEMTAKNQINHASKRMWDGQAVIEKNASTILIDESVKKLRDAPNNLNEYDLETLMDIKKTLRQRLINSFEMGSIAVYWPEKDIMISTETNLMMQKEMQKPLSNNKEWRGTEKGTYFFMRYNFGNVKSNETIVAIKMSDGLLLDTMEAISLHDNETTIILPDEKLIGGSNLFQSSVQKMLPEITKMTYSETKIITDIAGNIIVEKVPDSNVAIATLISLSNSNLIYTRNTIVILLVVIFIVGFGFSLIFLYYQNIVKKISLLTNELKKVEKGNYDTRIEYSKNNEFGYLFSQFNQMVSSIHKLLISLTKEMKQRELAEEKQFQSQIQPHFLYNSLFYIVSVADDSQAVTEMTRHLAEYYRYLTQKIDTVTIEDEVRFAYHYLMIQSLRKEFDFQINVDEEVKKLQILPLIIQPLIENAIEHGIEAKDGSMFIGLKISKQEEYCRIEVFDDGRGMQPEELDLLKKDISQDYRKNVSDKVGMWNVNQRLTNYYGKSAGLKFETIYLNGFKVYFEYEPKEGLEKYESSNRRR